LTYNCLFGDKFFQAVDYTDTNNQEQANGTLHTSETQLMEQTNLSFGTSFRT